MMMQSSVRSMFRAFPELSAMVPRTKKSMREPTSSERGTSTW